MSHSPPVPQGNQSPYPIQEPPHVHAEAKLPETAASGPASLLGDRFRDLPLLAIGAAIGLGAAAIGGAVFGLMQAKPKRRGKRKGRQ